MEFLKITFHRATVGISNAFLKHFFLPFSATNVNINKKSQNWFYSRGFFSQFHQKCLTLNYIFARCVKNAVILKMYALVASKLSAVNVQKLDVKYAIIDGVRIVKNVQMLKTIFLMVWMTITIHIGCKNACLINFLCRLWRWEWIIIKNILI